MESLPQTQDRILGEIRREVTTVRQSVHIRPFGDRALRGLAADHETLLRRVGLPVEEGSTRASEPHIGQVMFTTLVNIPEGDALAANHEALLRKVGAPVVEGSCRASLAFSVKVALRRLDLPGDLADRLKGGL